MYPIGREQLTAFPKMNVLKNFYMRGDFVRVVKSIMKLTAIIALIASLFGCGVDKPQMVDGPGMVYKDSEYRTQYANIFDFDSCEGTPYFAVAFLGYGEDKQDFRNTYVAGIFESLGNTAIEQVAHFDFEGDEWYLIVPRYKDYVTLTNLETGEKHTIYQGEAFTVKCNLSDLHSNVEISTEDSQGHKFSPQIGGDGRLVTSEDVWDITDYSVTDKSLYVKEVE